MVFVDQPWLCPGLLKIGVHLGIHGIGIGSIFATKAVTSIYLNVYRLYLDDISQDGGKIVAGSSCKTSRLQPKHARASKRKVQHNVR